MIDVLDGKKLGEFEYNHLKKEIEKLDEPDFMKERRKASLSRAEEMDLPGIPDEAWRRTDLSGINLNEYIYTKPKIKIKGADFSSYIKKGMLLTKFDEMKNNEERELIATFLEKLKLKEDYDKDTSYSTDIKETKFEALSEALFNSGVFIRIPEFMEVDNPIIIEIETDTTQDNAIIFPQIYVYAEAGSSVDIAVEYKSPDNVNLLSLGSLKVFLEEGAKAEILEYQNFGQNTMSFHKEYIKQDKDTKLIYDIISLGSKNSMWETENILIGKGAESKINGLVSSKDKQFLGNKMMIRHHSPRTYSDLLVKGVLKDSSNTLFIGNIKIPGESQKCEGYQQSKNLILGDKAHTDVIPRLEIIADDVSCSHGASIGSIDPEKLFYLTSRGIERTQAENILIKSFYNEIINKMQIIRKYKIVEDYIMKELNSVLDIELEIDHESEED